MNRLRNIFLAFLAALTLFSCKEFSELGRGEGYLNVSLERDDSVSTKAVYYPGQGQEMHVLVYKGDSSSPTVEVEDHTTLQGAIKLVADTYRIVAHSGTRRPVAWDHPFYIGETTVKVKADETVNAEVICKIDNVVVSVEVDEKFSGLISDYTVTVDNGEGQLVFTPEDVTSGRKAYFSVTDRIDWTIKFKNADGVEYTSSGSYDNVETRQHYKLKFSVANPEEVTSGAAGIKIVVDDSVNPEQEFTANVYFGLTSFPGIMTNEEFDVSGPVQFPAGDEKPKMLTAVANYGISSFVIRQKASVGGVSSYSIWYDLVEASKEEMNAIRAAGIEAESVAYGAKSATMDITRYVSNLGMGQYVLEALVFDTYGHKTMQTINLDIQSGVDAEVSFVEAGATTARIAAKWFASPRPDDLGLEYRAAGTEEWTQVSASEFSYDESIKTYSAVVTGLNVLSEYEFRPYSGRDTDLKTMSFRTGNTVEAVSSTPWGRFSVVKGRWIDLTGAPSGVRFEFREYGTDGWRQADASTIEYDNASKTFTGEIRGLKPNTIYEFRANSDGAAADELVMKDFRTEHANTVYNLSFDDWHLDGKVQYPFIGDHNKNANDMSNFVKYPNHLWDSANEGAATFIGSSTTPAEGSEAKSGKAARMESKYAVIAFAAGNLYTGDFGKIDGKGAILNWGIPFDSRPLALKGYYKYSPKAIDRTGDGMGGYKGQMDRMQIQICLVHGWDSPFRVETKNKKFVDWNADYVIAYGKLESSEAVGGYREFTIPLEYREKNLDKTPSHIIISACSSYLGDYFTGGEGSVLYVDEFSLEYNPENLTAEERNKVNYR